MLHNLSKDGINNLIVLIHLIVCVSRQNIVFFEQIFQARQVFVILIKQTKHVEIIVVTLWTRNLIKKNLCEQLY